MKGTIRYYTWTDVESAVNGLLEKNGWPTWLKQVRCYWDGLTLSVDPIDQSAITQWLSESFGPKLVMDDAGSHIALESDAAERHFPIVIEDSDPESHHSLRLTFELPGRLTPARNIQVGIQDPSFEVPLIAFHSFKGGVGRTTSAIALASLIAQAPFGKRVLLVDADLEAPGITFMLDDRLPDPPFAFSDLLALSLGDQSNDYEETLGLAASRLSNSTVDGITVLPAFRSAASYESVAIRPEHITRHASNPFIVSTLLRRLAKRCSCDVVIVDLRAGISEVAAGVLFDPSVRRVFVSSLSGQSLRGTASVLRRVVRSDSTIRANVTITPPQTFSAGELTLFLTQVRPEDRDRLADIETDMLFFESGANDSDVTDESPAEGTLVRALYADFDANLLSLPASWLQGLDRIIKSPLRESVRPLAEFLVETPEDQIVEEKGIEALRSKLKEIAAQMEYAEQGKSEDFLVTQPVVALASDHRTEAPAVAVVGAKGAGKSFMFLQMTRTLRWQTFVERCMLLKGSFDAAFWPMLQPTNLSDTAQLVTDKARQTFGTATGLSPRPPLEVIDKLREGLSTCGNESEWRQHWLNLIGFSFGLDFDGAFDKLTALLKEKAQSVVLTIDGLEDIFQELSESNVQKIALRSLLQDVIAWISQIPGRPIGIVIFVRRDMATASIKQNSSQFLSRFRPYELRWNPNEALRLVLWTWDKIRSSTGTSSVTDEELPTKLAPFWGIKLGASSSREAYSHEWVLSVLSDFRGQVQARDVMRLLKEASSRSIGDSHWLDRVLTPTALRRSVAACGEEKINEIGQESPELKAIFEALRKQPHERRVVPFVPKEIGLTSEQVDLLERNGIVLKEEDGFYMPELFRHGLNFTVPRGARPKVLALARRARSNPI